MAFATIRIVRHSAEKEQESVAQETRISTPGQEKLSADTVKADTTAVLQPVVFDNVRLDEMLAQIAAYYRVETVFRNESARQLRFHSPATVHLSDDRGQRPPHPCLFR
jgi:hypothetical protein